MEHVSKSPQNEIRTSIGIGSQESSSRDSQVPSEVAANSVMPQDPPLYLRCSFTGRTDSSSVWDRAVNTSNQPAPLVSNKMDQS